MSVANYAIETRQRCFHRDDVKRSRQCHVQQEVETKVQSCKLSFLYWLSDDYLLWLRLWLILSRLVLFWHVSLSRLLSWSWELFEDNCLENIAQPFAIKMKPVRVDLRSSTAGFAAHIEAVLVSQRWARPLFAVPVHHPVAQSERSTVSGRLGLIAEVAVPMSRRQRRT